MSGGGGLADILPPPGLCVLLASLSGLFNTLSTLAITYPTRQAALSGKRLSRTAELCMYVANFSLVGITNVIGIIANGQGPVAIAFPFAVATNILTILLGQWWLGMFHPTKPQRVGTMTLVFGVMMLPDIGPTELPHDVDVLALLREPISIAFISFSLLGTALGFASIKGKWIRDNSKLVLLYALVGGAGTVLNTSISKLVQLHMDAIAKVLLVVAYVGFSCVCLGVQAVANATLQDPSLFVPVSAGVNLFLNFIAGLCIWDDANRLQYPVGYCMLYMIVLWATYLLSNLDFFDATDDESGTNSSRSLEAKQPNTLNKTRQATFWGKGMQQVEMMTAHANYENDMLWNAGVHLRKLWFNKSTDGKATRRALTKYLKRSYDRKKIPTHKLIDLIVDLVEDEKCATGTCYTEKLEDWIKSNNTDFDCYRLKEDQHTPLIGPYIGASTNLFKNSDMQCP